MFRYYIIDLQDGLVNGTDNRKVCDNIPEYHVVIDTLKDKAIQFEDDVEGIGEYFL